jgi:hypothetical protein
MVKKRRRRARATHRVSVTLRGPGDGAPVPPTSSSSSSSSSSAAAAAAAAATTPYYNWGARRSVKNECGCALIFSFK